MEITLLIDEKEKQFTKDNFDLFDLLLVSKHLMEVEKFQAELANKEEADIQDTEKKIQMDADFMVMLFKERFTRDQFMTLKSKDYDLIEEFKVRALGGEDESEEKKSMN